MRAAARVVVIERDRQCGALEAHPGGGCILTPTPVDGRTRCAGARAGAGGCVGLVRLDRSDVGRCRTPGNRRSRHERHRHAREAPIGAGSRTSPRRPGSLHAATLPVGRRPPVAASGVARS